MGKDSVANDLIQLQSRFAQVVLWGFLAVPSAVLLLVMLIGMPPMESSEQISIVVLVVGLLSLVYAFVVTLYFRRFLLAKFFARIADQEAQVRAIVDHAAEGIIVVDATGDIAMINSAAQKLFGYEAAEVQGQSLTWLLPSLVDAAGAPHAMPQAQEVDGIHNSGRKLSLSVRVSEMAISGKTMYT
ncbi:MAG: PAS/PAC sensor hybrid histidine kinase, partial [Halothiobacillaceae bacterium]